MNRHGLRLRDDRQGFMLSGDFSACTGEGPVPGSPEQAVQLP